MVQLYVDGLLVYEPGMEGYEILGLTATTSVTAAGTAEIILPPDHPAYNAFVGYRTVITIYRNGELVFRGRALFPTDDFLGRRTITCEGERCFLRDAVIEPYRYQASPTIIFTDAINRYNLQVDEFKRFRIGTVSAPSLDSNDYQYIESESATQVSDVIDKLLEYVGGYITFSTAPDGARLINWVDELDSESGQVIEFGENLLDYARTDANEDLATVIYPYGAKDETTGSRVTIESVNGGRLYISDAAAVSLRGVIAKPVFWDDVTKPSNLLTKAKKYLDTCRMIVSTLELTAVDLSAIDQSVDSFRAGDLVRVVSIPHGLDAYFELKERKYDFLDPSKDTVVLGKDTMKLSSASVAGDKNTQSQIQRVEQSIKTDYKIYVDQAVSGIPGVDDIEDLTQRVEAAESTISQYDDEIASKVSRTEYEVALGTKADEADLEEIGRRVSVTESTITQHADQIASKVSHSEFDSLGTRVSNAESAITQQADQIATKVSRTELETGLAGKADSGDLTTLVTRVEEAESQITQQADLIATKVSTSTHETALATKADKSDLTTLTERVEEAESSITQQADLIATKVSRTEHETTVIELEGDIEAVSNRMSAAESQITQQADLIAAKVSTTTYTAGMSLKADKSEVINNYVQLEEPVAENIGDIWTQLDMRTWETIATQTWSQVKATTWGDTSGAIEPKTYVWDGGKWALCSDILRVTQAESAITQQADLIATKVSRTEYEAGIDDLEGDISAVGTRVSTVESTVTQNAESVTAEFNRIGLDGDQTGITKVDETGIEVTHSNISSKTAMNADGFRLYDASGNIIGGLFNLDGVVISAVQRLANTANTSFFVEVAPNIYGDGEHGLRLHYGDEDCGAFTAYSLDGELGLRIRSNGELRFGDANTSINLGDVYSVGHRVHFGLNAPVGEDGDIWLCPVNPLDVS